VAKGIITPRDEKLLADRFDAEAINDSMAFSMQGATSVSNIQNWRKTQTVIENNTRVSCSKSKELLRFPTQKLKRGIENSNLFIKINKELKYYVISIGLHIPSSL